MRQNTILGFGEEQSVDDGSRTVVAPSQSIISKNMAFILLGSTALIFLINYYLHLGDDKK